MTSEDKELLLKDLCARLAYGVICHYNCVTSYDTMILRKANCIGPLKGIIPMSNGSIGFMVGLVDKVNALHGDIKPYLRPMSSMTEEEFAEYEKANDLDTIDSSETLKENMKAKSRIRISKWYHGTDWLNAHHFDYRGLIEKGLALEAPKDMYNI